MASPTAYPKVPLKAWVALRNRAANAPSTKFTAATVAALLGMSSPRSAADNIVYPLRRLGLIDEDGGLTARGNKWRNDATYSEACDEILKDVYPDDLAALTDSDDRPDRAQIVTWLQHTGLGGSNATQMAATYALIASKTLPDSSTAERREAGRAAAPKKAARKARNASALATPAADSATAASLTSPSPAGGPVVHLDIQIHIPAAADAEQIDQIFASMAKHLYNR